MTKTWRLVDSGPCSASFNMALDEAIAAAVRREDQPTTLRLYAWDRPSVSLGCFQKTSGVNLSYCASRRIPVVRRLTGGRAILHDRELTYSLSARIDRPPFNEGLLDSYQKISAAFTHAFQDLGLPVAAKKQREKGRVLAKSHLCFLSSSFGEVLLQGRKLVGSAQKRWRDGLLQQGSIPLEFDRAMICAVFGQEEGALMQESAAGLLDCLPGLKGGVLQESISLSFRRTFGVRLDRCCPSRKELDHARELEAGKYLQPRWNLQQTLL